MEVSSDMSAAASLAELYAAATRAAEQVDPLDTAENTEKDVAAEASMFALKQTLELAGQIVDLLV